MRLDSAKIYLPDPLTKEIRLLKERENMEKLSKVREKVMSGVDEW